MGEFDAGRQRRGETKSFSLYKPSISRAHDPAQPHPALPIFMHASLYLCLNYRSSRPHPCPIMRPTRYNNIRPPKWLFTHVFSG
ncbi:hypothetical protein BDN70DRAFT_278860 [Pholiota conissans]|uniref:Uncharacterized protein n=1 Tax=Pholiota conissans TaxID=109636 RepID=A0A9P5ZD03_9AGAR|nr:hypothetical protein BDN70DRAFT_278860 [Pholiota conissans]